MSSLIGEEEETKESKGGKTQLPIQVEKQSYNQLLELSQEEKKPQLFLVRKPKPSEMQLDDGSLTEEERSKILLEKMLQL